MRILPLAFIMFLLVAAPAGAARNVKIGDDYYGRTGAKPTVTVSKGTTVKWNWKGRRQHNVVVQSGPRSFQSALKRSGSFKRKMTVRGTYRLICSIHAPDMRMKLVVR